MIQVANVGPNFAASRCSSSIDDAMRVLSTLVADSLREAGYVVREASGALAAMRAVLAEQFDVVRARPRVAGRPRDRSGARVSRRDDDAKDLCRRDDGAHRVGDVRRSAVVRRGANTHQADIAQQRLARSWNCFGDEDWTRERLLVNDRGPASFASLLLYSFGGVSSSSEIWAISSASRHAVSSTASSPSIARRSDSSCTAISSARRSVAERRMAPSRR